MGGQYIFLKILENDEYKKNLEICESDRVQGPSEETAGSSCLQVPFEHWPMQTSLCGSLVADSGGSVID